MIRKTDKGSYHEVIISIIRKKWVKEVTKRKYHKLLMRMYLLEQFMMKTVAVNL